MFKQKYKAFTLVELIVVITILAILGTIAFTSFQGYSKSARNSRRIADINNIKTSLELFSLNVGRYPLPDNGEEVSYSSELLRTQGTVGDNVTTNLSRNLKKKPLDPLIDTEYVYSAINTKKEYELMTFFEGNLLGNSNLIDKTYASSDVSTKILGNYNGIYVKSQNYVVPTPSIINSEILPLDFQTNTGAIDSAVVTGGSNVPDLGVGTINVSTGGLDINLSVYSGSLLSNPTAQQKIDIITTIQEAYSGTVLASDSLYTPILSATSDEEKEEIADVVILNNPAVVSVEPDEPRDESSDFISVWDTSISGTSANDEISLPLESDGTYNFTVDRGDNTISEITAFDQNEVTHTYSTGGTYEVKIYGEIIGFSFNNTGDKNKIQEIKNWGVLNVGNNNGYFYGCSNLIFTGTDSLDLTGTTDLSYMFYGASSFDSNINNWDTSNITNMSYMFTNATSFNQELSNWNVSNVLNMSYMFSGANKFNKNLNSWITSSLTDISYTFNGASLFNQELNNWNVSNVTDMNNMFNGASTFDKSLNTWNTGNVINMNYMFRDASLFNQDLNNWNVLNVTSMQGMFLSASVFNQELSNWDTDNVTDMKGMFMKASMFNKNLNSWDTDNVTDMGYMFQEASLFNQDLNNWNTGNVTDMMSMFRKATIFNGNISTWNVLKVTDMSRMFNETNFFNQDLNNWDTDNVTDMSIMFKKAKLFNGNISSWDVSSVKNMTSMFTEAEKFNGNISSWDVGSLLAASWMFFGTTLFNQDLSGWDVDQTTSCLQYYGGTTWSLGKPAFTCDYL